MNLHKHDGIHSYLRGHKVYFNVELQDWFYCDNNMSITSETRKCPRCGKYPTSKGHDQCIADMPGVLNACCGHGVEKGYVQYK